MCGLTVFVLKLSNLIARFSLPALTYAQFLTKSIIKAYSRLCKSNEFPQIVSLCYARCVHNKDCLSLPAVPFQLEKE